MCKFFWRRTLSWPFLLSAMQVVKKALQEKHGVTFCFVVFRGVCLHVFGVVLCVNEAVCVCVGFPDNLIVMYERHFVSRYSYVCVVESCMRMFVYLVVFRTCMHVHIFDSILCTQPSNCCVPESNVSRDVQILPVCVLCLWVLW